MVGNSRLRVELQGANGDGQAALSVLPGVAEVHDQGHGKYVVEHTAGSDPREAIFRLAVERDWVLITLAPSQASLEDVFVRLTTHEEDTVGIPPVAEEV
jgi:ABC-2 type transport system ATP-binding protein